MENLLTFTTVQDAINHALDSNLFKIDLVELENALTSKLVYFAKPYNTYFIIDEKHILTTH
jgi:hypothetical protein